MKRLLVQICAASFVFLASSSATAQVRVEALPEPGLQPQVVVSNSGVVHVVYLTGDPKACDVRHATRPAAGGAWSAPVTVNSVPHSAIAVGTIRGAQMVLGKDDTVQVIWNGHATPGAPQQAPLLHARMPAGARAFTPQQDLLGGTTALDGGASIAANARGHVSIVWHAAAGGGDGGKKGEGSRLVWERVSTDDGVTFSSAAPLNAGQPGVCACCSLRACLAADDTLTVLFRAATTPTARGMCLITRRKDGSSAILPLDDWRVAMCPMSSASLVLGLEGRLLGAWENDGRIAMGTFGGAGVPAVQTIGPAKSKHPVLVSNARGQTLIVSVIGSGWSKPGTLHWELVDASLQTLISGDGDKLPVWGHAAAYAHPDGSFVILR